jgi:hypothetical protein
MSVELKIKSKHLSLEAGVIRFEERKIRKQLEWHRERQTNDAKLDATWTSLNIHRRWDVRNENRATYLARAYLAGVPYASVEQKRKEENEYKFKTYILPRVVSMVEKYGPEKIKWVFDPVARKNVKDPESVKQFTKRIENWATYPVDTNK